MRVRPEYIPRLTLHRQSGQGRVTIDGRDYMLGPIADPATRLRYDDLIATWLANDRRMPSTGPRSVRELGERYLPFALNNYVKRGKPTSMVHIIRQAFALLTLAELDEGSPESFTHKDIRAFQSYLAGHPHQKWTRRTINAYASAVVQAFGWAAEHDLFDTAALVYAKLRTVKRLRRGRAVDEHTPAPREKPKVTPVSMDRYTPARAKMLPTVAAMVELQRLTGMRPLEVVMMRAGAITPTSNPSVLGYVVPPEGNKLDHLDKPRVVAIGPDAREILEPFLAGLKPTDYVFSPRRATDLFNEQQRATSVRWTRKDRGRPKRAKGSKFRSPTPGDHYTTNSYRRAIWRACDRAFPHPTLANVKQPTPEQRRELKAWKTAHRWNPNQLRHSLASELGVQESISVIQSVLGHASPTTTAGYIKVPSSEAVRVAAKRRKRPD